MRVNKTGRHKGFHKLATVSSSGKLKQIPNKIKNTGVIKTVKPKKLKMPKL